MIVSNSARLSHQANLIQNPIHLPPTDPSRFVFSNKKLQNINCIFKQSDDLGGLYLGDVVSTLKEDLLKSNNIRAILTCMAEKVNLNSTVNCHKILPIKDIFEYPIIQHFDEAVAWIEEKRKQKLNVLVHCHAGVSRSATIVIVYLIRTYNWNPFQAFQFVRQQRQRAKPNTSFWNQINQYYNFWSKQSQMHSNPHNNNFKENKEVHQISKKNSEGQISKRVKSIHEKGEEKKPESLQPTSKTIFNQPQQKQKVSISRRRRIFDKPEFEKSFANKCKRQQVNSQYYIQARMGPKQVVNNNFKAMHHQQSSILVEEGSLLGENKSSILLRHQGYPQQNIFKPRNQQVYFSPLLYNNNNGRPEIKFSLEPIQSHNFISPDMRPFVRSP